MRRRQTPPQQDPKQLNAAFLLKFAKMNYEGKNINPEMLNVFSNLLQHLSDNILKKPQSYTNQTIKALIDIAITVEFNLHMTEDLLSSSSDIQPVIKFLQALFNFIDKLFLFELKPNNQKIAEVIDLFWPLLASEKEIQKVQVKQFDKIASALQKIHNLPYIYEIEPFCGRLSSQSVLNESVEISFLQEKLQFSTVFRSVLFKYNQKNRVFIQSFLNYFQSSMNHQKDQKNLFQKCFNLLINISNCVGQKYNYVEIFFNKLISSSYPIRNFNFALTSMQDNTGIEKYYSNQHLLILSFIMVEKIINQKTINKQSAKALQIISKYSKSWTDLTPQALKINDFTQKINSNLIFQFVKFVIPSQTSQNIANSLNPAMMLQNSLLEAQKALFESGELDSKKIYEFFKQCQMSQEGDQWMDNSNRTGFGKFDSLQKSQLYINSIKNFSTIIQNLSKNKFILSQLRLNSFQKFQSLLHETFEKDIETQNKQKLIFNQIGSFIIKCFPNMIPDDWNEVLFKMSFIQENKKIENEEKKPQNKRICEIIQSLLIKKLEQIQTFSKMKQDFSFQEFIDRIFTVNSNNKQQIINFHFLIFYIFIKKCSSLPQKEEISQLQSISVVLVNKLNYFVDQYSKLYEKKENADLEKLKKLLLILEFFLILILDHPSSSYKLLLKKIVTQQGPEVANNLNLYDLITINQKQTSNSFFSSRSKHILGFSEEGQSLLCKNFLIMVQKLNDISFPENYLRQGAESKEEKKMKIFLNIKLNNIASSLRKSHKIPELIKKINLMRKTNSINSFEIILFSFCEFFEGISKHQNDQTQQIPQQIQIEGKEKQTFETSQSQFIVGFNYLLKINILINKFNENTNLEQQNDLSQKIYALQDIHSVIQETLIKIQQLILEQNRTFDLKTLIKIHQNIVESNHSIGGIAQKYNDLVIQGQMIRLISELTEDSQKLRMQFSQLALVTMKKLLNKDQKINDKIKQLQKIKLQQKNDQMNNENQVSQKIQEQQKTSEMKDLSTKLKQLYLIYYPYKHDLSLGNMLRTKTEVSILQLLEDSSQSSRLTKEEIQKLSNTIVEDLLKNISLVKEIIIKQSQEVSLQNENQLIWNFKYAGQTKFISFIVKSILKMFSSSQKDKNNFKIADKIFNISSQVLDNEEICELARKEIGKDLNQQLIAMVSGRIDEGCLMVRKKYESISPRKMKKGSNEGIQAEIKQIKDFHTTSTKLYNIIKKVINLESVNSQQIINSLILKDNLTSIQVTKFLLTQLISVSTFIVTKSDNLTETVFSYVMKANESYHAGKSQLQIPQFLCQFFNISHVDNIKNQIQSLQKSERSTIACSPNISYRCLKCDDKRMICYSCAVECHKGHPVIYLSEQRFPKCQCRQMGVDQCKLVKKSQEGKVPKPQPFKSMFSYESREPMRANRHQFFMMQDDRMYEQLHSFEEDDFRQSYRFGGARIRKPRQFQPMGRENIFSIDPLERGQSFFSQPLVRQQKKIQGSNQKITEENFDFEDQNYQIKSSQILSQDISRPSAISSIQSQSYLLPVFLQMFNDIYSNNEEVSSHKISSQNQKFSFSSLAAGKIMHNAWKGSNPGTYTVRLRKENQLNNKSPAVSKQVIAHNHKFILVSSGSTLFSHSKERFFMNLLDGKQTQSLANINQFTGNFDIHTIDFSPLDESVFIISGLHNILMLNISNDGLISKSTHHQRVNVNNDYINKVRTSSLGIFYSTSYEIKLLNWTFKPVLTIKSSADCLLKEWCLYQKSSGCTVYCVTAHGYTEYIDVTPADEGKKVFTNKVVDGRKVIQTGSSILVKDVQKIGKVYLASFKDKDGSNIIGNLQGDTVQNTSNFLLRNNFVNLFDKKYLIGQSEIIKGSQNQIFVICTIRESLTPQNSINQGQLTVFHVRKDKKCEFQLINTENKCQNFSVIPVGDSNWSIVSIHDDGSLHFSILQKPQKQVIDQQCKKLKQFQPTSNQKNSEKYSQLKQAIKKVINQDTLSEIELHPVNYFREFSENLKNNNDYKLNKKNLEYEVTLVNNSKVITGFTLPFIGNVYLPHRTVKNTVQVGLSNLEVLHYFVEGTLKFRVQKIQDYKTGMESLNQKFKQKYQRLQRLNQLAMDSERAMQILNTIKQVESMGSDQVQFYGQSVDSFKNKIPNFSQIFNETSSELSKDKKVQKMAIILQIFIQDSIKNENYLCQPFEIIEFVKNLRKISLGITKPQIYNILKNLIVSSLKMYEAQMGLKSHVFNDEFYPLKYATEQKANICYQILKGQINDNQVEESIDFWSQICNDDLSLGLLFLSKYPSLLAKIHKKSKKIDKIQIRQKLFKLYVLGYQVLKFKEHNCEWILGGICSLFTGQHKNKGLRETFYQVLMKYSNVQLPAWLKNVQQVDGEENVSNVNLVPKVSQVQEASLMAEDNMAALYGQFDMGEMDEQAMIKMAIQMSKIQMRQNDQNNFGLNNAGNIIEEQKQNIDDHAMLMQNEADERESQSKRTLLKDLVQHCTKDLTEPSQIAAPKIIILYVISKYVNQVEDIPTFNEILLQITKILADLSPSCDNLDKHILMAYLSVFSNILSTSKILKNNLSQTASDLYLVIKEEVINRLQNVKPQKVNKLKNPPNLLGRIFRGQKIYTFAHYAYGLVSLLLPPCQPLPILLSLECYWVLPQSKQFYTKMKHMTTIKEGISTGNIDKVYEVAKQDPEVWRQNADILWLQTCIQGKNLSWQKALELLALYYENEQISQ